MKSNIVCFQNVGTLNDSVHFPK